MYIDGTIMYQKLLTKAVDFYSVKDTQNATFDLHSVFLDIIYRTQSIQKFRTR